MGFGIRDKANSEAEEMVRKFGGSIAALDKALDEMQRFDAVRHVLEKTDRIILGQADTRVLFADPNPTLPGSPAWTDGKDIYLNRDLMASAFAAIDSGAFTIGEFLLLWLGTNYHEVGHQLFTPRHRSKFIISLKEMVTKDNNNPAYWHAYMALEDQRMETMYTSLYSATKLYFATAAYRWLLTDANGLAYAWPLVCGRRYLPIEVRMKCRAAFVAQFDEQLAQDFQEVIDAYLKVIFPKNELAAMRAIKKYKALMDRVTPDYGKGTNGPQTPLPETGCCDNLPPDSDPTNTSAAHNNVIRKESDPTIADQKEAMEWVEWNKQEEDEAQEAKEKAEADKGNKADKKPDSKPDPAPTSGDKADKPDGGGSDPKAGKADQAPSQPDENPASGGNGSDPGSNRDMTSETPWNKDASNISNDPVQSAINDALSQIKDSVKEALTDESLAQDLKDTQTSMTALASGKQTVSGEYGAASRVPPEEQFVGMSAKIVKQMRLVRQDLEPTWNRQEMVGRINANRAIRRMADPSVFDVFDQWDEGAEEEATIEMCVAIDLSGSMHSHIDQDCKYLWTLKRAFDQLQIRTTVLGFSDGTVVLYKPDDKAAKDLVPLFRTFGGTNPTDCMIKSYNILRNSQATSKVFLAITDGAWSGNQVIQDQILANMNKAGMTTACMYMGYRSLSYHGNKAGMKVEMEVDTTADVIEFVRKMVLEMTSKVVMQHK